MLFRRVVEFENDNPNFSLGISEAPRLRTHLLQKPYKRRTYMLNSSTYLLLKLQLERFGL